MPKCPCCHSEIKNFKGILFNDMERAVYVDNERFQLGKGPYRVLKAIYDHGPILPERLSMILYSRSDESSLAVLQSEASKARAILGHARLQIAHLLPGRGHSDDEYRVLEFQR